MNKLKLAIIGGTLIFSSCKKENQKIDPVINSANGSIQNDLTQLFKANEDLKTQSFNIDASQWQNITGTQGTRILFSPNSFQTKSGQAVTGNVKIELVEIFDKANMVLLNKPTNGKLANGDVSTLISGGELKVMAYQAGQELDLKSGNTFFINVSTNNTGGVDNQMNLFDGTELNGDLIWNQIVDTPMIEIDSAFQGGGSGFSYSWSDSSFGWTNIDKFFSDPRQKTEIYVKVPEGYDKTNCEVFISYDGEPTALASFDVYDNTTERFTEHYGLIPIGLEVHFIFVTEENGQIKSKIQAATITNNHVEVIDNIAVISKAQLTSDILGLP